MSATLTRLDDRASWDRTQAVALAAEEESRFVDLAHRLDRTDWAQPATNRPGWSVRNVGVHLLGQMRARRSVREQVRQQKQAAERTADLRSGWAQLHLEAGAEYGVDRLLAELSRAAAETHRGPWRSLPAVRRFVAVAVLVGAETEHWSIEYLMDRVALRGAWRDRLDVCRSTGRSMVLTPAHDGQIVADVVADWAERHAQPFTLSLTGTIGGVFTRGVDGEAVRLDAIEFCRTVAAPGARAGLMSQAVPF